MQFSYILSWSGLNMETFGQVRYHDSTIDVKPDHHHHLWLLGKGDPRVSVSVVHQRETFGKKKYSVYRCNTSWTVAVSGRGTVCTVVTFHGLWLFQAGVQCISL